MAAPGWLRPLGMGNKARGIIIAKAIHDLADAHGLPNSFTVGEIAGQTDFRLQPLGIGRLLQDRFTLPMIIDALKAQGIKYVRYRRADDGRSYIDLEKGTTR